MADHNETTFVEIRAILKQNAIAQAKTDEQLTEFTKGLNDLKKLFGSAQHNQGQINEEFICNSIIAQDKVLWGIYYDYVERNVKSRFGRTQGEYDCVAYNGDSIAIVEVKSKAHIKDIEKFPTMIRTFRILYPMYKDFKIYIGIASLHINNDVVQECQDNGYGICGCRATHWKNWIASLSLNKAPLADKRIIKNQNYLRSL